MITGVLPARARAALQRVWRRGLHWRYRLFQRRRHDHLVLEEVAGRPILVLPGVFNPKLFWTGEFLARSLDAGLVTDGVTVLDLGTGSGIGAVAAARRARRVVGVDINPAAVRCARINVLLNELEDRVDIRHGDLFAPVRGEQFDMVLFNPPYHAGVPRGPLDHAFLGAGVARRFAAGLRAHLRPGGHALVVLSSNGDLRGYLEALEGAGFSATPVAQRKLVGETLVVYRADWKRSC
jgi:release factor glutamine methyltransferase